MTIKQRIAEVLTASFFSSLVYYAAILPFLVLLFANPFWRNRFEAVSGIQVKANGSLCLQDQDKYPDLDS